MAMDMASPAHAVMNPVIPAKMAERVKPRQETIAPIADVIVGVGGNA